MENKKIDGLGLFARWVLPGIIGSIKGIVRQIENDDVRNPLESILEQVERLVGILSDGDKDNAAQAKDWALWHGAETAKQLGLLIVELLKNTKVKVPMFVTDWLRTIGVGE